jgi:hypothetical protein
MTILHATALTVAVLFLATAIGAVIATVWPARRKIIAALVGRGGE